MAADMPLITAQYKMRSI